MWFVAPPRGFLLRGLHLDAALPWYQAASPTRCMVEGATAPVLRPLDTRLFQLQYHVRVRTNKEISWIILDQLIQKS